MIKTFPLYIKWMKAGRQHLLNSYRIKCFFTSIAQISGVYVYRVGDCMLCLHINVGPLCFFHQNACFRPKRTWDTARKQEGEKGRDPAASQSAWLTGAELCLKYWGWGGVGSPHPHFQFTVTAAQCNSNNNNKWTDTCCMLSFFYAQHDSSTLQSRNERRIESRLSRASQDFSAIIQLSYQFNREVVLQLREEAYPP